MNLQQMSTGVRARSRAASRLREWLPMLAIAVVLFAPRSGHAGVFNPDFDALFVMPTVGGSVSRIGLAADRGFSAFDLNGFTYGGLLGFRLRGNFAVSLAADIQRTTAQVNFSPLSLNRAYLLLGLGAGIGQRPGFDSDRPPHRQASHACTLEVHFGFGGAWFNSDQPLPGGLATKTGLSVDYHALDWLAVGGMGSFEIQYFTTSNGPSFVGLGGTFLFRLILSL
jgi:hypothetical protein